jgi:hypothetical protein
MDGVIEHSGADMNPQICVFCQNAPADSKEHIYRGSYCQFAGANSYSHVDFNTGAVRRLSPGESAFNQKVKVVCAPCNNGWMNQIDE